MGGGTAEGGAVAQEPGQKEKPVASRSLRMRASADVVGNSSPANTDGKIKAVKAS